MSKSTSLKEYIDFKKTSVKSKSKIQDTERYISMFLDSSKRSLDQLGEKDVVKFLNSLNYSISTINGIKAYLKSFIKWYYVDWSARFRNLEQLCKTHKPPRTYSPDQMLSFEEFEKIVKAETDLAWKVYWLVFFYGGFRPSEACRLKWEQISFEPEGVIIKLRTTKTNKDFIKSLPKEAEHKLKELKQNSNSKFLFPSPFSDKDTIRSRTVCARLKRVSKKALGKEVVPYQLRHSIATILYSDDTKKDDDVAQQLGHTKDMRVAYKNMNGKQIREKARGLWGKKITPEKKEELENLRKELSAQKQLVDKFILKQNKEAELIVDILNTLDKKKIKIKN
jgi:integrase